MRTVILKHDFRYRAGPLLRVVYRPECVPFHDRRGQARRDHHQVLLAAFHRAVRRYEFALAFARSETLSSARTGGHLSGLDIVWRLNLHNYCSLRTTMAAVGSGPACIRPQNQIVVDPFSH